MAYGGDMCHMGASKLICQANLWTGPCVMQFLPEGRSETIILISAGVGKILVSCVLP